jgi:hypothetical protein
MPRKQKQSVLFLRQNTPKCKTNEVKSQTFLLGAPPNNFEGMSREQRVVLLHSINKFYRTESASMILGNNGLIKRTGELLLTADMISTYFRSDSSVCVS